MDHFFQELNVKLHTEVMGNDLCITISGGDRPHIGSIAIADPRESLTGDGSTSATVSTYNFTGHKDHEVADVIARAVASKKNCRTVVVCGLHYDSVDDELFRKVRNLTEEIISLLTA